MRLDSIFARNAGARYRATPPSPSVQLTAADRTRAYTTAQSTWDSDVVKRVSKDTLGNKASTCSGSEPHRRVLWDSLFVGLQDAFASKDATASTIFDLVDVDQEVHPVYNELLLRSYPGFVDNAEFSSEEAIEASGAGSLDDPDRHAKRQLLSALDPEFYKEVITPLRLDTKLDQVSLDEIYAHVCEVWWCANPDGPQQPRKPGLVTAAYASDRHASSEFIDEFDRVLREALSLLHALRDPAAREAPPGPVEPHSPPPRRDGPPKGRRPGVSFPPSKWRDASNRPGGKFHGRSGFGSRFAAPPLPKGGQLFTTLECPLCPGHYHDTARCSAVDGACSGDATAAAHELDDVVSAFQAAFDDNDDAAFAQLCQQHEAPLVRSDPDPFTYPADLDLGLRAQYAGLTAPAPADPGISTRLAEARAVLAGLRDATAAARAAAPSQPGRVSFGTASLAPVVPPPPPTDPPPAVPPSAVEDPDPGPPAGLAPLSAYDPANFETPFGETFAGRFALQIEQDPALHFDSFSFPNPPSVWGPPLSEIDIDSDSEGDDPAPGPDPVRPAAHPPEGILRVPAPRGARLAAGLLSLLTLFGCTPAACGSVVPCTAAAVPPAVPPVWLAANPGGPGPELSPPALPPDPPPTFPFTPPLSFPTDLLPGYGTGYLLDSRLWLLDSGCGLDSGSGHWLPSGLWSWFCYLVSGFWLNSFDNPDYFVNNGELCTSADHPRGG
ncbi:hypothetical protein CYMTET_16367 [Cymbomonas tetramitiformis]|uniref:Uncharacterized protein n=1 Tax=Cymbomonas tetramitiformis TaxID=36881 RepID=A0AAE0GC99_9CHLO|nr:hypothetical protein CYMTET_16367 [Cymbomonas tetramitiformis]